MKSKKFIYSILISFSIALAGCKDKNEIQSSIPLDARGFLNEVLANPLMIDGNQLSDSWRVTCEKYSYDDNGNVKSEEIDLMADPRYSAYKEYWIFGKDSVFHLHMGQLYGKNDDYKAKFRMHPNENSKVLTIDFVYDGGSKKYSEDWSITSITDNALVLTNDNKDKNYYYQYTFRKENFLNHSQ